MTARELFTQGRATELSLASSGITRGFYLARGAACPPSVTPLLASHVNFTTKVRAWPLDGAP